MVQPKSQFRDLKRVDGTTQEFVWYFQFRKFFISVNNCSCSHRNFGQTGGDLSFWVPFHFKDIGHMASSTKKCDHETSSFCVAFGSLGFFLTSTFPALKHHQPCILLQSASQLQLSIGAFGKTKLQELLDPKTLYESIFSSVFLRAHLPGRLFVQKGSIASAQENSTIVASA